MDIEGTLLGGGSKKVPENIMFSKNENQTVGGLSNFQVKHHVFQK